MKHPSAAVRAIAMAWLATLLQSTSAHEITDNRATLALRDPTLLSVTLYIDYTTVLQRVLAPKASRTEFVLAMAAVEEVEFRRQVQRAHERLQAGTRLRVNGRQPTALARWSWPDIGSAHRRLRQQAMAALGPLPCLHLEQHALHKRVRCGWFCALGIILEQRLQEFVVRVHRQTSMPKCSRMRKSERRTTDLSVPKGRSSRALASLWL